MLNSREDVSKAACNALAEKLADEDTVQLVRQLQAAGLLNENRGGGEKPTPSVDEDGPTPISIWRPVEKDGRLCFERPPAQPLGDHYAATPVLDPQKPEGVCRVCFFGESAAAGYLYAPHITPAQVLENHLNSISRDSPFEVIDLARTNETLSSLVTTARASLQLNPDILVVFTGNNWNLLETSEHSPYLPSLKGRQRFAAALRENGVVGPIDQAGEALANKIGEAMAALDVIAREAGIPLVLVTPEVNLVDWETRQPVLWLPEIDLMCWYELLADARSLLANQRWEDAIEKALAMLKLDQGTCPTTYRLMANAFLGCGEEGKAKEACRAEIDSAYYATLGFLAAPQINSMGRTLQQRAALFHGFKWVDLSMVFSAYFGGGTPDRRLFLDYCHLTIEGMHVAMGAAAAGVLESVKGTPHDWGDVLRRLPYPEVPPEVEAVARLGAAVHCAHRHLPVSEKRPLILYWCRQALSVSPGIAETMMDLVRIRCSPCPAVLHEAQQRNLASPYRLTLQHGWRYAYLDVDVIACICEALEEAGHPARAEADRLLFEHFGVGSEPVDLVYPTFYLWEPLERFYPEVMTFDDLTEHAIHRSPWPVSSFCLVADGKKNIHLSLAARTPNEVTDPVVIKLNGGWVGEMNVGTGWTRQRFQIKRRRLKPGINKLEIHWPFPQCSGGRALEDAIARLEKGLEANLHPVFGELAALTVHI